MLTLKHWYDLEFLKLYFVSFSLKLNFRKRYKINFGTLLKKFLSCFSICSRALMALDIYISLLTIAIYKTMNLGVLGLRSAIQWKIVYDVTAKLNWWKSIERWKWIKRFWNKEVCNLFCCDRRTKTGTESSTRGRMVDFAFACSDGLPLSYRNLTYWRY